MTNTFSLCMAYLDKIPVAQTGAGGHNATLQAALACKRFGLSASEAWQAMTWYNDNRCNPKWSERELRHKLKSVDGLTINKPLGQTRAAPMARTFTPPARPVKLADTRPIIQRSPQAEETSWAQWCIAHDTTLEAFDRKVGNA